MRVLAGAKPNVINRLNAGIYRIVSRYGDANAKVEADVTVEAGKLTEATVSHQAARVTFKLVTRVGGEALPDTQWTVQTPDGQWSLQSVGALPTHILAPGTYSVTAKSSAGVYKRDFTLANGDAAQVEVLDAVAARHALLEVRQHPVRRAAVALHASFDGIMLASPAQLAEQRPRDLPVLARRGEITARLGHVAQRQPGLGVRILVVRRSSPRECSAATALQRPAPRRLSSRHCASNK